MMSFIRRQINLFLWLSLITITAFLLSKLAKLLAVWIKARRIPGPPCPSFYGHSRLISRDTFPDLLSKLHDKYGPIVKLWLGPTQLLVSVKDPGLIKEMLLKAKDKFSLTGRALFLAFGSSSLFVSSFDKAERKRNSMAVELNGKLLGRANSIPRDIVDSAMERLQHLMDKGGLDCATASQHFAVTVLGATLFGDGFLAWSKTDVYKELLLTIAKDGCYWASYNVAPFWKQEFWRYQQLCSKLKCLTKEIIQQCRQKDRSCCEMSQKPGSDRNGTGQLAASFAPNLARNGICSNLFLWNVDDDSDTADNHCGELISLMFHGSSMTASLVGNILARMVIQPEIQDKIHTEIIVARKHFYRQDQEDISMMPLLLATVYECARLLPAGPLLQRCSTQHDLYLKNGMRIPSEAIVVVPIQLVQTDETIWGKNARLFDPYRFLSRSEGGPDLCCKSSLAGSVEEVVDNAQSSYVMKDPNENAAFLSFGSGARACIGEQLAILGICRFLASLLEHYEVRFQPGLESNAKPMAENYMFQRLPSLKIMFKKRILN